MAFHPIGESVLLYFCSFLPPTSLCGTDVPISVPPVPPGGSVYAFFAAYGCYFAQSSGPAAYFSSVLVIGGAAAGSVFAKDSAFIFDFFFSSNSTLTGNSYLAGAEIGTGATLSIVEGVTSIQLAGFSQILWGPGTVNVTNGAHLVNGSGGAWANAALQVATAQIDGNTTAWTPPVNGTFVNNGVSQVTTTGVGGTNAFPANAPISWALQTVGGTIAAQPYFSQAQAAKNFYTQASAGDTSTYAWTAGPGTDTLSGANLDIYLSMNNPYTGSSYSKAEAV